MSILRQLSLFSLFLIVFGVVAGTSMLTLGNLAQLVKLERSHYKSLREVQYIAEQMTEERIAPPARKHRLKDLMTLSNELVESVTQMRSTIAFYEPPLFHLFGYGDIVMIIEKDKEDTRLLKEAISVMGEDDLSIDGYFEIRDYLIAVQENLNYLSKDIPQLSEQLVAIISKIIFVAIALLVLAFMRLKSTIGLLNPLCDVVDAFKRDEYDEPVAYQERADEIGKIAQGMENLRCSQLDAAELRRKQDREQAKALMRKDKMEGLISQFGDRLSPPIESLRRNAESMGGLSHDLTTVVSDTRQQSAAVEAASHDTASNVASVASACEALSQAADDISQQLGNTNARINEAVNQSEQADQLMTSLSEVTDSINGVIELIDDIAGQINLLALNATIESARAGEAGKGFAVVAQEVKNLSSQTTKATEQIRGEIEKLKDTTDEVIQTSQTVSGAIQQVSEYANGISGAMDRQSETVQMVIQNMQTATRDIDHILQSICKVSKSIEEVDRSAESMTSSSQSLDKRSTELDNQFTKFIDDIRAIQ